MPLRIAYIACLGLCLTGSAGAAASIVPAPKDYREQGSEPVRLPSPVTIVVPEHATPIERCAAETFQSRIRRTCGQEWSIRPETETTAGTRIVLGRRETCRQVEQLCSAHSIRLDTTSPGREGFYIEIFQQPKSCTLLLAGVDERGVLYGQDTLAQILGRDEQGMYCRPAIIRDAPIVPWRGRPQTQVVHHLQPGIMDCYVLSRVNFIDLRNGTYAFEPDYVLTDKDKSNIRTVIEESRRRGIVVFATINCAVKRDKYDAVMQQFQAFLDLGADALWPSFDDKGPGEAPEEIVARVLELGRRHHITGQRIAITPPKGSYQTIDVPFNQKVMKVPGMEQALWFWTRVPSADAEAEAQSIGLKCHPSWWHNWPRPDSGFSHIQGGPISGSGYLEVPPMSAGWHEPPDSWLADGGRYLEAVMPWGGNNWEQYYMMPVIGWWGWNPETYDFAAARKRIYTMIFGAENVAAATEFDDTLVKAKTLFIYPTRHASEWNPPCPPRLRLREDKDTAKALLGRLDSLLGTIEKSPPRASILPGDRLEHLLKTMHTEVQIGKAGTELAFPEYAWDAHQRKLLDALYAGESKKVDELAQSSRDTLVASVESVQKTLPELSITKRYVDTWLGWARLDAVGWKQLVDRRREELTKRIKDYGWFEVRIDKLLKESRNLPYGRERGGTDRQWRVVATVLPEQKEQFSGDWVAGVAPYNKEDFAVFALDRDANTKPGAYSELPVTIPFEKAGPHPGLLIYMNRHTKDLLGMEVVPGRWSGFASIELLCGDQVLWKGDVGLARDGSEWDLVHLPKLPPNPDQCRLRVTTLRESDGMRGIFFVGAIRLLELPR